MIKSICIISYGYPTKDNPEMAFIQPVARGFADSGIDCYVIAPQSISVLMKSNRKRRPYKWIDRTQNGNEVTIFQPTTLSVSNIRFGGFYPSVFLAERAIVKCYLKEKLNTQVLYGHFWKSAMRAAILSKHDHNIVVAVSGESDVQNEMTGYSQKDIEQRIGCISGVICVSTKNQKESQTLGLLHDRIPSVILPNGFSPSSFFKMDRKAARKRLNLPEDVFIAISVGTYSERKGTNRIIQAASAIPNLKLVLIGSGQPLSSTSQVIISGSKPHDELVYYLNAADFFVLPTLAEGCCNAIIEALACGLPVISSNLPFNDDILDENNSIKINPMDIQALRESMTMLIEDELLRNRLSDGALRQAKQLTIKARVEKIRQFIQSIASDENPDLR